MTLLDIRNLPDWVDRLYGRDKPDNVVDTLVAERRIEAERESEDVEVGVEVHCIR